MKKIEKLLINMQELKDLQFNMKICKQIYKNKFNY